MKTRQVIYCEIAYKNTLACFPVRGTEDYYKKLAELKAYAGEVQVMFREYSDGTIEDGDLEEEALV